MAEFKILMSNIGYARGISGSLSHHLFYAHRHVYCSFRVQKIVLAELKQLVLREKPDLCCLVEIDKGTWTSRFNQLHALLDQHYCFYDIANKYGERGGLKALPVMHSKCNAFFANRSLDFKRIYLSVGYKRLVYKISLNPELSVFFCHFSLRKSVRVQQFAELRNLIEQTPGDHIVLGDFNILTGLRELQALTEGTDLILLNDPVQTTFRFHRQRLLLDLCFCSQRLRDQAKLRVIEQPYSDHAALLLTLEDINVEPEAC